MSLLREDELGIYGEKFLCELYRRAQGITERHFDRLDIFNALQLGAFKGEGVRQATDEIVQFLRHKGWIQTSKKNDDVRLRDDRLQETKRRCKTFNPVTMPP